MSEFDSVLAPPSVPLGRQIVSAIGIGLAFAFVGMVIGLRVIAFATLPHILVPGGNLDFQEVSDRLPIPHLLDWNQTLIEGLLAISQMNPAFLILAGTLLCSLLWLPAVRVVDPSFRLFIPMGALPEDSIATQSRQATPGDSSAVPESFSVDSSPEISEEGAPVIQIDEEIQSSLVDDTSSERTELLPPPEPVAPQKTVLFAPNAKRLNTTDLGRAFTRLLLVVLPVMVVWLLAAWLQSRLGATTEPTDVIGTQRISLLSELYFLLPLLTLGILFWLVFGRKALAAPSPPPPSQTQFPASDLSLVEEAEAVPPPLVSPSPGRQVLTGALFGICAYGLLRWAMPGPLQTLLLRYHTLGTFHQGYWNRITGCYLLSVGAVWFALGALLFALGRSQIRPMSRLTLLSLPVAALLLALTARSPLNVRSQAARYDWKPSILAAAFPYRSDRPSTGVPSGIEAGQELSALTRIPAGPQPAQPERSVVLFFPNGPLNVRQQGITEDNLTAELASAKSAQTFLEKRRYETALSWMAIKHLYNVATVHFDTTAAMQACMTDMIHCPHLAQCGQTTRNMLFTSAASPQNKAILDQWASDSLFAHPTRDSRKLMGDLYRHYGAVSDALKWYRRADMPPTFLERIQKEKPLFHEGQITGKLTWNGKPLTGVQVGVIPHRLNGLPPDLEQDVLVAAREILSAYSPRPFSFRWISTGTLTDSSGQFTLKYLTEGDYLLVCTLPPDTLLTPLADPALQVHNPPPRLLLNYTTPIQNLGTIELTLRR